MAENDGKMTPEERQRAVNWLNTKAPNMRCSACGHTSFSIAEHFFSPPIHYGGNMVLGGPNYPQFVVVCHNCGHMMGFSAIASGVIQKSPPDGK
ncbi:hypothetical protein ACVDG5_027735 [Mesorhizobium sp. ORM6]